MCIHELKIFICNEINWGSTLQYWNDDIFNSLSHTVTRNKEDLTNVIKYMSYFKSIYTNYVTFRNNKTIARS